jgi:hypothetical protein
VARIAFCAVVMASAIVRDTIAAEPVKILFIGNSFTYGAGTAVKTYRPATVTDLNDGKVGGVPSLFKAFTVQAHLNYDVSLETVGGKGLDYHVKEKAGVISKPWDVVCMHGYSTLDERRPGDPSLLVASTQQIAKLLHDSNPFVVIYLTATWARADQVYRDKGVWHGKTTIMMTMDLRNAYDQAAAASPFVRGIIPVGEAWERAMVIGLADANPYDGIDAGKVDLWGKDHYHGSVCGYYLEALTIFGVVTGHDPRSLGKHEQVANDLGISPDQATAMQRIAFEQMPKQEKR